MGKHILVVGVIILTLFSIKAKNLYEEIRDRPNLSEARRLFDMDRLLEMDISRKPYTAFIPSNDAIVQYINNTGDTYIDAHMLRYHLVNIPYRIGDLPHEINTDFMGSPKLYVTKVPSVNPRMSGLEDFDYYINNARVTEANINSTSDLGDRQVLHVVDALIIPTFSNPDAMTLLTNYQDYGIEESLSVSKFKDKVQQLDIMGVFEQPGPSTFFIPINSGTINMIDKEVVYSQILPMEVLFTRTAQDPNKQYSSHSLDDNMKALISIEKLKDPYYDTEVYYVKSQILHSEEFHKNGVVLARIMHGNIPVKNGVVHLIDRPLMVVASSIMSYLREDDDNLMLFYELLRENYRELVEQLNRESARLTLFAPSNNAFYYYNEDLFRTIKSDKHRLGELLKTHLIPEIITTNMINNKSLRQLNTLSDHQKLYINIDSSNSSNPIITLDAAGGNAKILTPNIPTKNGVVHIIDRVLGMPYLTVHEALMSISMLSSTAALGTQDEWNYYLYSRDKKFTFFAPSNDAWDSIKREMPFHHKNIFSGNFSYHVKRILDKHLRVGNDFSISELTTLMKYGNHTKEKLQMIRGMIDFEIEIENISENSNDEEEYYIESKGVRAKLIRSDVKCFNGIIHIIDKVLMKPTDVSINGSSTYVTNELFIIGSVIFISAFTVLSLY